MNVDLSLIYIKKSTLPNCGNWIFALQNIDANTIIEISPALKISENTFNNKKDTNSYLALGNGSLFNHHTDNNIDYVVNSDKSEVMFTTNRICVKGEELFINYGNDWFPSRTLKEIQWYIKLNTKINNNFWHDCGNKCGQHYFWYFIYYWTIPIILNRINQYRNC